MTTPAPVKSTARARRAAQRAAAGPRPRLRMGLNGFLVAWLAPNLVMAAIVAALSLIPGLQEFGSLTPLLSVVGIAGLVVGLPLCLLVNVAFRHVTNQWVHVLAYALVGMLYGLVVLTQGAGGVLPMLIPVIGFPAGVLMGLGRMAARPLVDVVTPGAEDPAAA
ncbi:hypothetical protein AAG742_01575 [Micrococcus sp. 2A]|uniref:hypothetical protein n=1 Tax=Micrococcus TaxID=1269 RepID=UPI00200436CF|nr:MULTISPECIES: hypothetical protein [unclassified Micrococcus]MCK6095484.1 hypothetical protein [Micrococcus sp. EYE_212]MCK6171559.1 hypothetical protein [Micrococcus sp. EYE_162]MDX2341439.1 hypothetical protein [Micrococcus sp. M4NT]